MYVVEIEYRDPAEAAGALRHLPLLTFLDSAAPDKRLGRYSFVAVDPFERFRLDHAGADWAAKLEAALAACRITTLPGLPPFQGGAAGLFSYELGHGLERLPRAEFDDLGFPDLSLGFYDVVVAFDSFERRGWIVSTGLPESDERSRDRRAIARATWLAAELARGPAAAATGPIALEAWTSNFTRASYEAAVRTVIERILAGDIFQANISQRFTAPVPEGFDHFGFYRRLRTVNPAPFAGFLDHGDFVIASASPERFLRVEHGQVEARPIKGTRPRFSDPVLDLLQAQVLTESRKDRAENTMIVDLLRNDLSKACVPGSVQVPQLCGLESFASVHHLVSAVVGRLGKGRTAVDLLAGAFPGGSITGAPKVRAMEIITEIERHARGPYCGAIGYIGFDGTMDLNIVIRTAAFRNGICAVQAGGGIVTASDPAAEYQETLDKASRVLEAFGVAELAH